VCKLLGQGRTRQCSGWDLTSHLQSRPLVQVAPPSFFAEVRETLESDLQTLNQYKESFNSIKEVAELNDVDAIIAQFLQQEAENFALFNYVTELNGEIEGRQEEVNALQQNIDSMREEQQWTVAAAEHELELLLVC